VREDGPLTAGQPIPEGRRNETLFRIGCAMRGRGAKEEEILAVIRVENRRCEPPLWEAELIGIARSAARYRPGP
jgi:putative DNA primase/helicase